MTHKRLFVLNAVIAAGYGVALLVAARPILDLYGTTPNPEGVYVARWFGVGLLAVGLVTWLARDAAESAGGQAIGRALAVTYGIGVVLALWGRWLALQHPRLDRGGPEPAAGVGLCLPPAQQAQGRVEHTGPERPATGHTVMSGRLSAEGRGVGLAIRGLPQTAAEQLALTGTARAALRGRQRPQPGPPGRLSASSTTRP